MKKLIACIVILVITVTMITPAFAQAQIRVLVEGEQIQFAGQGPAIIQGRTLVPVRGVFEHMGFAVQWDGGAQQATLVNDNYTVVLTIGSSAFTNNGVRYTLDVPAQIINGSTMLPLRAVLESVGYDLGWNGATSTVSITEIPTIEIGDRRFRVTLTALDLSNMDLTDDDIIPLQYMTNLTRLDLSGNQIRELTALAGLRSLTHIFLTNNMIRDFSPVEHVANLNRGTQRMSSITLPNRRLTDAERQEWIADYIDFGGATAVELEVIRLINIERANYGLSQVQMDNSLMLAARFFAQQAHDLRGIWTYPVGVYPAGRSHNFGPYASNPSARHGASANVAEAFGANLRWNGGNWFSSGTMSASSLVSGWMNSPGHRNYILSPEHRFIGVGQFPGGVSYLFLTDQASR